MKMSNHRLPVFLTIKHRPLAWLYSTVVLRFGREKKKCAWLLGGTQLFQKNQINKCYNKPLSRASRPKAGALFVFDLKCWVLTHWSLLVNVLEKGSQIQNVVESLGTNHGKYRGRNGSTVKISCWADLARPSAGIKNSPKNLCSHVIFIVFFKF